ncbi:MaoC family dehydratase N-terminal domain-containing protein [Novosphingobium sp. P6W]|uniref:FAS1-like dehydratase domain-containing protein n=1 Tax=Novosphingobium sp. P6W TaxID=1609758 RepID=UPI0005C67AEC|nr:MaoC family dehydratase N-terminal domain-containing protein [Novosphingobium sp. P6W]AXB80198.1 acyl dehydratase [Novosphingobium sp. P6W]
MTTKHKEYPKDESGLGLNFGTYEEALEWIGRSTEPTEGEFAVNVPMIRYYCSAIEDANASYWDADFAQDNWGGPVAPPGMLQTWTIPMQWKPEGRSTVSVMAAKVPLPGDKPINVTTDFEFFEPVREGDRLTMTDRLVAISEEKTTRVGTGHFITSITEYRNQAGSLLARSTNTLFRYKSED